jgi:hypothetical protein
MAVYHGVIKNNRVELEGDARLPEGTLVEVRPRAVQAHDAMPTAEDDAAADALLRAEGLLGEEPPAPRGARVPFDPVVVQGEPLSEQIIRERR